MRGLNITALWRHQCQVDAHLLQIVIFFFVIFVFKSGETGRLQQEAAECQPAVFVDGKNGSKVT